MFYVEKSRFNSLGVLENGIDDFQNTEDVYEAIGEVLQEISIDKTEDEIKWGLFFITWRVLYFSFAGTFVPNYLNY